MKTGMVAIYTEQYEFVTDGVEIDLVDLTPEIREFIKRSQIEDGRLTIFVIGTTAAIFTTEYEPFLVKDTKEILEDLISSEKEYLHDQIENNTHQHLRSTLLGPELTIPVQNGEPMLDNWQQVVYADFDNRPRTRVVALQMIGVKPQNIESIQS